MPSGISIRKPTIHDYRSSCQAASPCSTGQSINDRHACAVWHHCARPADLLFALSLSWPIL